MQGGEIFNKFQLKHQEIRWPAELVQGVPNDPCEAVPIRQRLRRETYGGVQIYVRCGFQSFLRLFTSALETWMACIPGMRHATEKYMEGYRQRPV